MQAHRLTVWVARGAAREAAAAPTRSVAGCVRGVVVVEMVAVVWMVVVLMIVVVLYVLVSDIDVVGGE